LVCSRRFSDSQAVRYESTTFFRFSTTNYADKGIEYLVSTTNYADKRIELVSTTNYADKRIELVQLITRINEL